jgi:hypothetical protein
MFLAFQTNTLRIIHMKIDVKGWWILGWEPTEMSRGQFTPVSIIVDNAINRDAVQH